jgi:hypothetical protein
MLTVIGGPSLGSWGDGMDSPPSMLRASESAGVVVLVGGRSAQSKDAEQRRWECREQGSGKCRFKGCRDARKFVDRENVC